MLVSNSFGHRFCFPTSRGEYGEGFENEASTHVEAWLSYVGIMYSAFYVGDKVRPDDPSLVGNPMTDVADWQTRFIPMVVHGDGVSFTNNGNKLLVTSLSFLLVPGWSVANTFMTAVFAGFNRVYEAIHGSDTWGVIWEYLLSGFTSAFDGFHAPLDPFGRPWPAGSFAAEMAGKPMCGGRERGVIWLGSMDAEYAANELKYPHYNCCGQVCGLCPVRQSNFRDFRKNATFKSNLYQPGPNDSKISSHAFWRIPGVSRFTYRGDEMHGLALGPLSWLHASAMWSLLSTEFGIFGPGSVEARVSRLWSLIQEAYDACVVEKRLTNLSIGMVGKSNHLPALGCKAMEGRALIKPMLHIFQNLARNDVLLGSHDGHVIACYTCLLQFYEIIDGYGILLPANAAAHLLKVTEDFLLHYNWLNWWAQQRGETMYKTTTKHHTFWHIAYLAQFMSPRAGWTYAFEDFVGKVKRR